MYEAVIIDTREAPEAYLRINFHYRDLERLEPITAKYYITTLEPRKFTYLAYILYSLLISMQVSSVTVVS